MLAWYTVKSLNQNEKRLDAGDNATKDATKLLVEILAHKFTPLQ